MYFLSQWDGGQPAALDITLISSLQAATVCDAAVIQGSALGVAETRKQALHTAACHRVGVNFYPLAVEALGGWCPSAVSIIHSISRLLAQRNPADTCCHLFQHLSVALWWGNTAMWIACQPPIPPSVDVLIWGASLHHFHYFHLYVIVFLFLFLSFFVFCLIIIIIIIIIIINSRKW